MDTLYVFKAKYCNTLRRVTVPKELPTFSALEGLIRRQFKLEDDLSLIITYKDADGDIVTLASDDDVMDAVVYQQLNPLRLEVSIDGEDAATDADTISMDGSQLYGSAVYVPKSASIVSEAPADAVNSAIPTESAPESKTDNTTASAAKPAFPESPKNPVEVVKDDSASEAVPTAEVASASRAEKKESQGAAAAATAAASEEDDFDHHAAQMEEIARFVGLKLNEVLTAHGGLQNVIRMYEPLLASAAPAFGEVLKAAVEQGLHCTAEQVRAATAEAASASEAACKEASKAAATASASAAAAVSKSKAAVESATAAAAEAAGKAAAEVTTAAAAAAAAVKGATSASSAAEATKPTKPAKAAKDAASTAAASSEAVGKPVHVCVTCDVCNVNPIVGIRYKSTMKHNYDLCESCFKASGVPSEYVAIEKPHDPRTFQAARGPMRVCSLAPASMCAQVSASSCSSAAPDLVACKAVHRGIICDVCNTNPIVGTRYKSLVKHDYDLCEACFKAQAVNPAEYSAIERPAPYRHPAQRQGYDPRLQGPFGMGGRHCRPHHPYPHPHPHPHHPFGPHPHRHPYACPPSSSLPFFTPPSHGRLDARFVSDMTVKDGEEFPPGAPFTKVWRLRNNGPAPWPQDTQVVHVGGDLLCSSPAFVLPLPQGGLPPSAEVDVEVDMLAPAQPGRYISHWRLLAPGGPKFGHRFWALINVTDAPAAGVPVPAVPIAAAAAAAHAAAPGLVVEPLTTAAAAEPVVNKSFATFATTSSADARKAEGQAMPVPVAVNTAPATAADTSTLEEAEDPIIAAVKAAALSAAVTTAASDAVEAPAERIVNTPAAPAANAVQTIAPVAASPAVNPPAALAAPDAAVSATAPAAVPPAGSSAAAAPTSPSTSDESTPVGNFAFVNLDDITAAMNKPTAPTSVSNSADAAVATYPPLRFDDFPALGTAAPAAVATSSTPSAFDSFFKGYPEVGAPSLNAPPSAAAAFGAGSATAASAAAAATSTSAGNRAAGSINSRLVEIDDVFGDFVMMPRAMDAGKVEEKKGKKERKEKGGRKSSGRFVADCDSEDSGSEELEMEEPVVEEYKSDDVAAGAGNRTSAEEGDWKLAALVGQLKAMGFPHNRVNEYVLEESGRSVENAVEKLMKVAEWEDQIGDLMEMDFTNEEDNILALLRNDGSVKRAVRDLVKLAKEERKTKK